MGSLVYKGIWILILGNIFNFIGVKFFTTFENKSLEEKDKRIVLSKDVIEGIKCLKYFSWENIFKIKIDKIRKRVSFL